MALRVLSDIGQVWRRGRCRLSCPSSSITASGRGTTSLTLHGLVPALSELRELRAFVPNVTLLLDDLGRQSDGELRQRELVSAMGPIGAVALEGRVEGERALLRALIVHKFGVIPRSVEAALETADEPSLSVWAERIFSARSAEDVVA